MTSGFCAPPFSTSSPGRPRPLSPTHSQPRNIPSSLQIWCHLSVKGFLLLGAPDELYPYFLIFSAEESSKHTTPFNHTGGGATAPILYFGGLAWADKDLCESPYLPCPFGPKLRRAVYHSLPEMTYQSYARTQPAGRLHNSFASATSWA
jgi:hypothetical protein